MPAPPTANRIPAVERAAAVLGALAQDGGGQIAELSVALGIPRSTVYRILNSLEAHGLVVRAAEQGYRLGPALVRLARAVPLGADLVSVARPAMDALALRLGVTVKLSVLDADSALVVAVAEGPQTYSVTTQIGRRFPLHAGAASKVLAAFGDAALQARLLAAPLARHTATTITDSRALAAVLAAVRRAGHAEDNGEFVAGVAAIGAPIFDAAGGCVAAVSIPYLPDQRGRQRRALRDGVVGCAQAVTQSLGGQAA
jgi:DNA-binding IclR family transcriptional regulator